MMNRTLRNRLLIPAIVACLSVCLASAQKQAPPEGGKPKDFKVPAVKTLSLENGLAVSLIHYGNIPRATVRFVIRTGAINEPLNQIWISSLATDFLKEGTATRSSRQIAEAVAGMGGQIASGAGDDTCTLGGTVLSEFIPDFLRLLGDILANSSFPASELPRIQANYLRRIVLLKSQPGTLASAGFSHELYGDHPYGRLFPAEEMIKGYTAASIKKFYEENFGAKRTHLYVAGVFDDAQVEAAIREALRGWRPGNAVVNNVPAPKSHHSIYVLDRPGSVQSTIMVGLPVVNPAHKDYIPLQVTDSLLGGAFSSRITANIREDKGYTYSPGSTISTHYRDGCWFESADVSTEVTGPALKEIFFEIDRLAAAAPPEAELKAIKNNFAGIFVLQNSTPGGIISQLAFLEMHGLGREYLDTYVQNIFKVTPAEVQRIARDQLRSRDMTVYIVGDYAKIKDQVAPYGVAIRAEIK